MQNNVQMNTKERLLKLIANLKSTPSEFEKDCGISNGYINNIRKSICENVWDKINKKFPDINKIWLLHG